jgi:hypothetical protein
MYSPTLQPVVAERGLAQPACPGSMKGLSGRPRCYQFGLNTSAVRMVSVPSRLASL